jgi:hypothetical protein
MPDSLSRFDVRGSVVSVDRHGVLSSVAHSGRPALSYLRMDLPTALAPEWSSTGLVIDDDEVESTFTGDGGLELTVRHTFVAGWQFRCALQNSSVETRSVRLLLPLALGAETVGWAVAEGSEAELFVQPKDGRGLILAGRLRQGSVERIDPDGLVLPEVNLEPRSRYVLGWEWDWLPRAAAYVRKRPTIHPRASTVVRGDVVVVPGGPDVAIVPSADVVLASSSSAAYELCSVEPLIAQIELRSARGLRRLQVQWTPTPGELLREAANGLLAVPPGPVGVVGLPGLPEALTVQWALGAETLDAPDDAADALDLFTARLFTGPLIAAHADQGLAALYLIGEYERSGDRDLLEAATRQALGATRPVPGLGLAASRVSLARVALGLSPQSIMDHLLRLAHRAPTTGAELDGLASVAELLALTRSVETLSAPTAAVGGDALLELVGAFGATLGAGLPGGPVRPLPGGELGHLLTVLRMLPDAVAERGGRTWGLSASDLGEQRVPMLIAGLLGREVDAGHVWLALLAGRD